MIKTRNNVFVWVTWLAKLMADNQCAWAIWFMSHYQGYRTPDDGFDLLAYKRDHQELLRTRREELLNQGALVFSEDQNSFKLHGRSATLAGKPDLVYFPNPRDRSVGFVEDVKTGQRRDTDVCQVQLYMYSLSKGAYPNTKFSGRLIYKDGVVEVPADSINQRFKEILGSIMTTLASDIPALRVPSARECSFCRITTDDCPERIERADFAEQLETLDF